jgi:regulatory protein
VSLRRRIAEAAAHAAAVAMLARRDLASSELALRLEGRGFSREDIEAAVASLREEGMVDDARYAQAQVLSRSERGQGPLRIRNHLLGAGVPPPLVEAALAEGPDWAALAAEVRQRRFGSESPRGESDAAQQARFLQYRGFSGEQIRRVTGVDLDGD